MSDGYTILITLKLIGILAQYLLVILALVIVIIFFKIF